MKKNNILSAFEHEETEVEDIAKKVMENSHLLSEFFVGISSTNSRIKFGSVKTLRIISERKPEMLYSRMDFFVNLLDSKNNILKMDCLGYNCKPKRIDSHSEFNKLFKKFYGYLYEGSLITASHVVDNSSKIALSKPELQDKITEELLKVEEVTLPTKECRNILIGKAIKAFEVYYDNFKDKDKVISFVKRQSNNPRNATKARADKFLKRLKTTSEIMR